MTGITHKALVKEIASNKPNAATAFNLPDSATAPARSFDSALASGAVVAYNATNGTDWEDGLGTFTAGSPDTLARSQILDSSTGSAIDFSAGADVVVRIVWPAAIATEADLLMRSVVPGGRLTLSSGNPDYQPQNAVAVSGQDTSADTITVTAHGWTAGTMVKSSATSGGLTAGTQYYAGNITTNTISLHTTLAAALAGTSKVDITGTVTANLTASGVANQTIYYTPYNHNLINLWDGFRWQTAEFAETSLSLGTLTASKPYDVFAYLNAGVLALELLAWTSDTVRATNVIRQDGRLCKSGDKTRLLLGTLYTRDTTSVEKSTSLCYLANLYNKLAQRMFKYDPAASWEYSSTTVRQVNANTNNQIDFVIVTPETKVTVFNKAKAKNSTSTIREVYFGIGFDLITSANIAFFGGIADVSSAVSISQSAGGDYIFTVPGKHYAAALERGAGTDTQTWYGSAAGQSLSLFYDA